MANSYKLKVCKNDCIYIYIYIYIYINYSFNYWHTLKLDQKSLFQNGDWKIEIYTNYGRI